MSTYADTDVGLFADAGYAERYSRDSWDAYADGLRAAEDAKEQAFAAIDAKDYNDETARIVRAIVTASWQHAEFSANDLRASLGDVHPPRIGRAFALAQQLGFIEFVGYVKSTDVGTHAKKINLYRRCS